MLALGPVTRAAEWRDGAAGLGGMAARLSRWLLLALTLALIGCDHGTKLVATGLERSVPLVSGWVELVYTQNDDTAFSLLRHVDLPGRPSILIVAQLLGALVVAGLWWRRARGGGRLPPASPLEHVAWSLVVAGAIGNATDRLLRGYVVDFIHVRHWPVFNVADVLVVLGAVVLVATLGRRVGRPSPAVGP